MKYSEIIFDMNVDQHPTGSISYYTLKRWTKYTIYAKSGSWNRTDNPQENWYSTSSVYLYDYICVSEKYWNELVYTSSVIDDTPAEQDAEYPGGLWTHRENTFKNSPNMTVNNVQLQYNPVASSVSPVRARYGYCPLYYAGTEYSDPIVFNGGEYFEIVRGYPRNHLTHKRGLFSLYRLKTYGISYGAVVSGSYRRCQQTIDTTVGEDGLGDGTSPVQSVQVGNLNLIQGENVIN